MTCSDKQKYVGSVTVFTTESVIRRYIRTRPEKKKKKEENPDLRIANLIAKLVLPLHYRILRNKLSLPAKAAIKPAQAPYDPNTTCKPLRVMSGRNMARELSL